jgi:hypothetical protein
MLGVRQFAHFSQHAVIRMNFLVGQMVGKKFDAAPSLQLRLRETVYRTTAPVSIGRRQGSIDFNKAQLNKYRQGVRHR